MTWQLPRNSISRTAPEAPADATSTNASMALLAVENHPPSSSRVAVRGGEPGLDRDQPGVDRGALQGVERRGQHHGRGRLAKLPLGLASNMADLVGASHAVISRNRVHDLDDLTEGHRDAVDRDGDAALEGQLDDGLVILARGRLGSPGVAHGRGQVGGLPRSGDDNGPAPEVRDHPRRRVDVLGGLDGRDPESGREVRHETVEPAPIGPDPAVRHHLGVLHPCHLHQHRGDGRAGERRGTGRAVAAGRAGPERR